METHRHQIEKIKHLLVDPTGYVPDENPWSDLYLVRNLQESRASVLKNALSRGAIVSEHNVQTLSCVEVTELDRNECPCAPASGCYWLRSDKPIPREIKITSVTGIVANNENPRFQYMKWERFQYIPKARYQSTRTALYYTIRTTTDKENHIYLYGNRFLSSIAISGIWEDPMLAAAYPKCGEKQIEAYCNPFDVNFYTDLNYIDQIVQMSVQKLQPRSTTTPDPRNDDTYKPLTGSK